MGDVTLKAEEWMNLINGVDGELQHCCANISNLRQIIIEIAIGGGGVGYYEITEFKKFYQEALNGHQLTNIPSLQKMLKQINDIYNKNYKK